MQQLSSVDLRLNYDRGCIMLIRANYSPRDAQGNITKRMTDQEVRDQLGQLREDEITQGYLWTEATISPKKSQIQFPLVDTQNIANSPVTPTMRLLTMQDSFLIASMSYFIMNYTMTGGDQNNINFATDNCWAPITYVSAWNSNQLNTDLDPGCAIFWTGAYLSLEVNKKLLIPYWDCYRHYNAPQTQAAPGLSYNSPEQRRQNQHDGSVDGFYPVEPNVVIGGGRGNILKLNLAANIPEDIHPFNDDDYGVGFVIKAVVCTRGILLQNSTNVK